MTNYIPVNEFVRKTSLAEGKASFDKINYACGVNVRHGWLNVDFFDGSLLWQFKDSGIPQYLIDNVLNIDLLKHHPFHDNTFMFAHCEDFIEHIDQKSAILLLAEILRALRPGGVLRIATPGLEGVLVDHFSSGSSEVCRREAPGAYDQWGHQHFFCHETLEMVALGLGFSDYRRETFGTSNYSELRNLETRPDQSALNIYAEMHKPM